MFGQNTQHTGRALKEIERPSKILQLLHVQAWKQWMDQLESFERLLGYEKLIRRTVSIEVGMQNSGLGSALAVKHFTPSAATPCAISAIMHCIIGSVLAALWRRDAEKMDNGERGPITSAIIDEEDEP
ncbi:MAG: hypothetical protein QF685_08920 [Verrucomicrobiota bacterium]|jgi:hypothetical protein|nr:hypothetical protein [Verrucomicrobiota bacterium]